MDRTGRHDRRKHGSAGSAGQVGWWLMLLPAIIAGCALPLRFGVDWMRELNPDMLYSIEASGLTGLIGYEELDACGPTRELAALIPDCPMPGICFTAACTNHDLCYSSCGTHQSFCDEVFFWDMIHLCDTATSDYFEQNRCYSLAYIYYRAVQTYGIFFFPATQEIVCARASRDRFADSTPADASIEAVSALAAPFVDGDDDLMPDDWEAETYLDPTNPQDAWLDYDGDGRVNLAEYTHGTDPYVPE